MPELILYSNRNRRFHPVSKQVSKIAQASFAHGQLQVVRSGGCTRSAVFTGDDGKHLLLNSFIDLLTLLARLHSLH